jgi:hypothetical protein
MTKRESNLVVINTVQGEMTAQVMKAHLESEGIPVLLQPENLGTFYGVPADGLRAVKILVPQEFAEEAKQILKGGTSSEPA